jgi:hypothetical protein
MSNSKAALGRRHGRSANARDSLTHEQVDFLARLATLLGMPAEDGTSIVAPRLITGPSGLACRLHVMQGMAAVRPEALLPMSADELSGAEMSRLLRVQSLILGEFGWYLGISSEGLLQLSSLVWIDDPQDVATALDLVNGVGTAVLHSLLHDASANAADTASVRH